MLQYVNGFSCAIDEEKREFILNFVQRFPKIKEGNIGEEMEIEVISSLAMDKKVAERLRSALNDVLEDENEDVE